MEPTKKIRSLLRSRTTKKRGIPIFVSPRSISECEHVPMVIPEPEVLPCVNEVTVSKGGSSSVGYLFASTNERGNTTKCLPGDLFDSTETIKTGVHRRHVKRTRDNVSQHKKPFVVSLPSIALEKRLDFNSRCDDIKCRPGPVPLTGKIQPKNISLPVTASGSGRKGGISV